MTDHATPQRNATGQPRPKPPESLAREILAVLFLYAVLTIIPLAIGAAFAPG